MKKVILAAVYFSGLTTAMATDEYRILTDKKGREIEAKIMHVSPDGEKVTVQCRGQRKSVTAPIAAFDNQSQVRIRNWVMGKDFQNKRLLDVKFKTVKKEWENSPFKNANASWVIFLNHVEIDVENKSKYSFADVTFEYTLFYYIEKPVDKGNRNFTKEQRQGVFYKRQTLGIESGSKDKIITEELKLTTLPTADGDWPSLDAEIEGIIVRLSWHTDDGANVTREIIHPKGLKRTWTTKTKKIADEW